MYLWLVLTLEMADYSELNAEWPTILRNEINDYIGKCNNVMY